MDTAAYRTHIDAFQTLMDASAHLADIRLTEDTWTLKEMVAHLVDSAANNHQRFVRLQLEPVLVFPKYDAEEWRNVTGIGPFGYADVLALWKSYNLFLLHLIESVNPAALCHVWRREDGDITLEALIRDYFVHMELHRKLFAERAAEIRAVEGKA
ncbi:DinB family protein [Desulfomicrobium escambiense]|uniref:DinB family protein n=1 Tax=Desulfomicrobium escambiense TaxID=29503 RepID=UPI0003F7D347|nr:DinB family protein [Desulfomicrobium escambiense]